LRGRRCVGELGLKRQAFGREDGDDARRVGGSWRGLAKVSDSKRRTA